VLMLKIIFLKKIYIILICFEMKSTLKNNYYHTPKQTITVSILIFTAAISMKHAKPTKKKYHPYHSDKARFVG